MTCLTTSPTVSMDTGLMSGSPEADLRIRIWPRKYQQEDGAEKGGRKVANTECAMSHLAQKMTGGLWEQGSEHSG